MAWNTLSVIAGEIKSPSEARQNQLGYDWSYGVYNSTDDKHTGTYAAYCIGPGDGLGTSMAILSWTTFRLGFWFKTNGWWAGSPFAFIMGYGAEDNALDYTYYVVIDFDTYQLKLVEYAAGVPIILDTHNDVTPLLGNINDWKHISFYQNTSTNSLKFWVNGQLMLSGALHNPLNTRFIYVASSGFFADLGGYIFVDDLYFDYSTSSEADDIPPARRYYPALPDGAGTYTEWTPDSGSNYDRVNDSSAPDDDTSYVTTDSDSNVDSYTFAALSNIAPEADADCAVVQAYVRTNPIEGGLGKLGFMTRLGGIELSAASQHIRRQQDSNWSISTPTFRDWTVLTGYFDTKPTGGEWSEADFNSAEFGIVSDGII